MKYIFIFISIIYTLTGCGGGTSDSIARDSNNTLSSQSDNNDSSEIDMKLDHAYTVQPGDKIEKTSDDAEVTITHTEGHQKSKVTLIAGSAILIRK